MVKKRLLQISLQTLIAAILLVPAPGALVQGALFAPPEAPPQAPDAVSFVIVPGPSNQTTEGGGTAAFTVAFTATDPAPTADVTVSLSSSDTSEGTVPPDQLTFTPANFDQPQNVIVTGVDDQVADGNVSYTINLSSTSADATYHAVTGSYGLVNVDNEGISVTPTSGLITDEAGGSDTFDVQLTSQPAGNVSIPIQSGDPSEGTVSLISLDFDSTNWNIAQTVTVMGEDDDIDDGDIVYTIQIGPASSPGNPDYHGLTHPGVSVTNKDNDTAGFNVTPNAGLVTDENGVMKPTFEVVLVTQPQGNVIFKITSNDTTEGIVDKPSLTFTPANWGTPQVFVVTGVSDEDKDGDIPYTIEIAIDTDQTTASEYRNLSSKAVSLTNRDEYIGPQAHQDFYDTPEDTTLMKPSSEGVLRNDSKPASAVQLVRGALHGVASLQSDGGFTYTPNQDYFGPDSFTYEFSDGSLTSNEGTVSITVKSVNDAPQAANDIYYTNSYTRTVKVAAPGVLMNDSDVDKDPLTADQSSGPSPSGTLTFNPEGSFDFVPSTSTDGTFTFTYQAKDLKDAWSDPAEVQILIDTIKPTVGWVGPKKDGEAYYPKLGQPTVRLEVSAADDAQAPVLDVVYVRFMAWDPTIGDHGNWVSLGVVYEPPYMLDVPLALLRPQWNEISAQAVDQARNASEARLLIYNYTRIMLPFVLH